MVCTSLDSLLRPLFYFLCSILLIHRVDLKFLRRLDLSSNKQALFSFFPLSERDMFSPKCSDGVVKSGLDISSGESKLSEGRERPERPRRHPHPGRVQTVD